MECRSGVNGQPQVGLLDVVITAVNHQDSEQRSERILAVTLGGDSPEKTGYIQLIGCTAAEDHNTILRGNWRCELNYIHLEVACFPFSLKKRAIFFMRMPHFSNEMRKLSAVNNIPP